jgi:hypothetical protein
MQEFIRIMRDVSFATLKGIREIPSAAAKS